jgi:predicted phage-related endonuclease
MAGKKTPNTMLSASRLPAVMGLSKYSTPNDELEFSIAAIRGDEQANKQNESMAWGDRLEGVILWEVARRLELIDVNLNHEQAYYHDSLPLCCSLDGTGDGHGQVMTTDPDRGIFVIGQDNIQLDGVGVLEAKLTAVSPEDAPALYRGPIQLQGQMDIVKAKWGAVCVLYRGTELRIFLFAPHVQTVEAISQVTTDFQARLDKFKLSGGVDFYPPASSDDADRMYPVAEDKTVQLDSEAEYLAAKILDAKQRATQAETDRADAEKDLKVLLGDAKAGVAGKYEIKWPMRGFKAQPQKIVPAKEAYSIRQSTLSIKEVTA